ncbi:uncharacterized protein LOC110610438 isoform X1 [Manihot esculenta]|uniref:GTD-binding domain-containing protein n=2 Tax=Manihot esculenta TaxID=3983 RepID=A0A2C9W7I5_MANES|nr:uncharacterized protein LOC110610438 isoform X1 [Manihot esculenta]KAG8658434.1 hypothetical protein MANES_03G147800v8 [Manihot esculenta]OAY55361.1 hypothetical protein MANES_03G147800v8 [Manihot esculenta]
MPCNEVESWTFSGLVGAFLDLSIAYLLLCASTLAYSASKFLGIFGLSLPCPCNGLFGDPNSDNCWQRALVDCPSEKISSVQFSVMSKFPFDSILDKNLNQKNCENKCFGFDDEASYSSFRKRSEGGVGSGVMDAKDVQEERSDIKGKGVLNQKSRHALRRRRKGASDNGRMSSVSSCDPFQWDAQALCPSPASVSKMVNEANEESIVPDSSGGLALNYGRESSMDMGLLGREPPDFESNEPVSENNSMEKVASPEDDLKFNEQVKLSFDPDENYAISFLEKALKEEHAARAALNLELEKERNAAATAADEAMAMILRLQEEKASIEMEARQYQRMIEEKSAYDLEEMNILKEILLRREREKHFLEKEVETYRQMIFGSEQMHYDAQDIGTSLEKRPSTLQYSGKDPLQMTQRINESVCEKENADNTLAFGKELPIPKLDEVFPQEREMQLQFDLSTAEGYILHEKPVGAIEEVKRQSGTISTSGGLASKIIQTCNKTDNIFPHNCDDSNKDYQFSCNTQLNMDAYVHDIHVIDDKFDLCCDVGGNGSEKLLVNTALDIPVSCASPATSSSQTEKDISRSCSDITSGLPPLGCTLRKPLVSVFRRNSMSAVDYERLKIDNEVGRLWERLRVVQEGRGKLNISMEHREKDKIHLQLLENIVSQLREIQQLKQPGKTVRQVSLPPPSCKIMSKKRRWRSVSLEVQKST